MKKIIAKIAIAAALAGAASLVTAAPAAAQVRFGITLGVPGYYGGYRAPYYGVSCDPYSRYYDPYRCGYGYGYGYPYSYGPSLYIGGGSRYYGGSYYRGPSYRGSYGNYRGNGGGSFRGNGGGNRGGGRRR